MAKSNSTATTAADTTRLDDNVTDPATTAPGDAPADTTDPLERASTVTPQPSAEALAVGTVNGVLPLPTPTVTDVAEDHRFEEYDATDPAGRTVRVRHNLDTGATELV